MKTILVVLGFLAVLASAPVHAAGANAATCRKAIQAKKTCVGARPASPQRQACFQAAMARCKAQGVGAL